MSKRDKNKNSEKSLSPYSSFKTEKDDWGVLIGKHKLRWEIWMLLSVFNELNITQISKYVKHSKSTVWRHLTEMEKDKLVLSRKLEINYKGKIPPTFYRINQEFERKRMTPESVKTKDPKLRRRYYQDFIRWYRNSMFHLKKLLDLTQPLIDYFESQLDDIEKADEIYQKYLASKYAPMAFTWLFDKVRFDKYLKLNYEQYERLKELEKEQQSDEIELLKGFIHFEVRLPIEMLYEFQKEISKK